ncbi:MAG: HAMP domain-containing sensor histidine kinase [Cyanobacteria bacterium P01_F01_bin.150]
MKDTLQGAAKGVDIPELLSLYKDGSPNNEGFSDDIRFYNQLNWLDAIHQTEPQAWFYLFILGNSNNNRRIGTSSVPKGESEIIYIVDLWTKYDKNKASRFLESDIPNLRAQKVIQSKEIAIHSEIYTDKWGDWLSATAPLFNSDGDVVAMLGLDIEASYIAQLQEKIWNRILASFAISYIILIVLMYSLSGKLTYQLVTLTKLVKNASNGDYNSPITTNKSTYFPDEFNYLSSKFIKMLDKIAVREKQIIEGKINENNILLDLQSEKKTNEFRSRFISTISHEFRTPLTIIKTSTELLERYGDRATEEKKKTYFNRIKTTVENMTILLDNILEINRENIIKLKLNPEWFNLNRFCQEIICETIDAYGKEHQIHFSAAEIPEWVYLDPMLLRSMLSNILSNAIKYSSPEYPIEFEVLNLQTHIQFQVKDYGIGIPLEDQAHLFEAFHRAPNAIHIRGTGLGLQIVKHIVELHHGHINIESQENRGSTFTIRVPLSQ